MGGGSRKPGRYRDRRRHANKYADLAAEKSPVPPLFRGCLGKVKHAQPAEAEAARRKMEARTGKPFHVYYCSACGRYHIGSAGD